MIWHKGKRFSIANQLIYLALAVLMRLRKLSDQSQAVSMPTSGNGIACYASSGNTLLVASGSGGVLPVGTSFSGTIWMNYTSSSATPGPSNPFYTVKIATITVKAS